VAIGNPIENAGFCLGLALEFCVHRAQLSRSISQPRALFDALLIVLDFITVDTADVVENKAWPINWIPYL
jgi:hypothetical protein